MGHLIFITLHFFAFLFGFFGLFITIPLHIIYSAVYKPKPPIKMSTKEAYHAALSGKEVK
jgi:predicted PurR-regulated permease PerM